MRHAVCFVAACLLATIALATAAQMHHKEDISADLSLASFLAAEDASDAAFNSQLRALVGDSLDVEEAAMAPAPASFLQLDENIVPLVVEKKPQPASARLGVVLRGGNMRGPQPPDMSQSAADGSTLAPFDPFRIQKWHDKRTARRLARRQKKIDEQTQLEYKQAALKREKRRIKLEKREQRRERAAAKLAAAKAKVKQDEDVETDLVETGATSLLSVSAGSTLEAELEQEEALDLEEEAAHELEARADAAEAMEDLRQAERDMGVPHASSLMETEADADAVAELEADAEGESETEGEAEGEAEAETESESEESNMSGEPALLEVSEEDFDNGGGRAVFARRDATLNTLHFERTDLSSGGQAVVNGVTKLPCGKEVTDKGLFAPAISANLQATVEAANPEAPVRVDENIALIKKLPVNPELRKEAGVDEYGDEQAAEDM